VTDNGRRRVLNVAEIEEEVWQQIQKSVSVARTGSISSTSFAHAP